jgi:TrmH family RNA methyltransferase
MRFRTLFESISDTRNPQGILAGWGLINVHQGCQVPGGLYCLTDGIRDPGGIWNYYQKADADGCAGVLIPEGCVGSYIPKVLRSTMGSVYHLPIWHCGSIQEALSSARKWIYVYAFIWTDQQII